MKKMIFILLILFINIGISRSNEIVAIINDQKIITSNELDEFLKIKMLLSKQYDTTKFNHVMSIAKKQILQELVNNKLVVMHANKNNDFKINNDVMIDNYIKEIAKNFKIDSSKVYNHFEKLGISKQSLDSYIIDDITKNIIISDLVMSQKQEIINEAMLYLKKNKIPENDKNIADAKLRIAIAKQQEIASNFFQLLRRNYYFEIL